MPGIHVFNKLFYDINMLTGSDTGKTSCWF